MTKSNQAYLFICVILPSTPQGYCGILMRWPKTRFTPQWVLDGIISVMILLPLVLGAISEIASAPHWSWWSTDRGWADLTWLGDRSSDWSGHSTQEEWCSVLYHSVIFWRDWRARAWWLLMYWLIFVRLWSNDLRYLHEDE